MMEGIDGFPIRPGMTQFKIVSGLDDGVAAPRLHRGSQWVAGKEDYGWVTAPASSSFATIRTTQQWFDEQSVVMV